MFLVCGEALYDVFLGSHDQTSSMPMKGVVGGSPLNVAIGMARLGVKVGFLAGISNDTLGENLLRHIALEGVMTDFIRRRPEPTTLSLVALNQNGVPAYSFYGHRAADRSLSEADLPILTDTTAGLHFGSYTLVTQPIADAFAVLASREKARLISLDPNVRLTVEPDREIWRQRILRFLPNTAVVKVSDEDLALLWPEQCQETLARRWLEHGPALVVLTRGSRGASAFTRNFQIDCHAYPVEVVDTVGAGDGFQAALLTGLIQSGIRNHEDIRSLSRSAVEAILHVCCKAAAIACSRQGADLASANDLSMA